MTRLIVLEKGGVVRVISNVFERKKLEARVKKLMKLRAKKPGQALKEFLYEHQHV